MTRLTRRRRCWRARARSTDLGVNSGTQEGENVSQVAEIVNGVYSADTVTANYVQFWFRRFHSGHFCVKDAPRTGRLVIENVNKITEIMEVDR
ncbi:histone-lysine N-methyltransferase SETMAR [Trichonephila clavipes]|nr:histone-lysine N-methyltransferase SETMAR [Trichonephila clavipes]